MLDEQHRQRLRTALGIAIRKLRYERGISQERLALESHTDRAYMSALERGINTASLEAIWKLLPHLGVTFEQFGAEIDKALRKRPHGKKGAT